MKSDKNKKTCCDCGCGRLPPCSSKKKAGCACNSKNGGCACNSKNGGCACSNIKLKILKKY